MSDFDDVKDQADSLGIAYRADIKQETLEKKVAAWEAPVAPQSNFTNKTTNNIFTSQGKVSTGACVDIDADEAKAAGLE